QEASRGDHRPDQPNATLSAQAHRQGARGTAAADKSRQRAVKAMDHRALRYGPEGHGLVAEAEETKTDAKAQAIKGAKAQATSISRTKPWILQGISRASWYRLRETTSCQVKLINKTEHESVSPHQAEPPQEAKPEKESTEKEPTISNAKIMFQAQKT